MTGSRAMMAAVLLVAAAVVVDDRLRNPWRCKTWSTCFPQYPREYL